MRLSSLLTTASNHSSSLFLRLSFLSVSVSPSPTHPCPFNISQVALPLRQLVYKNEATLPPHDGDIWRINFSRVEWAVQVPPPSPCHYIASTLSDYIPILATIT